MPPRHVTAKASPTVAAAATLEAAAHATTGTTDASPVHADNTAPVLAHYTTMFGMQVKCVLTDSRVLEGAAAVHELLHGRAQELHVHPPVAALLRLLLPSAAAAAAAAVVANKQWQQRSQ